MNAHRNRRQVERRRGDRGGDGLLRGLVSRRQAQAQEKAAFPTLGTIERLDPRFDKLVPARRAGRADRRGVRLVGRAGLGPFAKRSCSSRTFR